VSENRVLRRVEKTRNEELHNVHYPPNIIRMLRADRQAGVIACMGDKLNAHVLSVGKYEGKKPPGRYRHR
jgi:hypothetical protein